MNVQVLKEQFILRTENVLENRGMADKSEEMRACYEYFYQLLSQSATFSTDKPSNKYSSFYLSCVSKKLEETHLTQRDFINFNPFPS